MLYKKNFAKTLDLNLFKNPTAEYRGTPFWSWNCKLDKAQLCRQIEHMRDMGFGGFHMHPRTGLATEYLSDEFMDMVSACCDKAESENMLAWLYDEDRWSSGPAGGKVTKTKKFRRKRLKWFTEDKGWNTPKDEAIEKGLPYLLSCYDVVLDKDGYLDSYCRIGLNDTAKGTKWYAYCINEKEDAWFNWQTYFDAMDKEAVAEFIKVTHERYKSVIGERFDKSVPAIFTDEPNADHEKIVSIPTPEYKGEIKRTWTRFYEEEFKNTYGEDVLDTLPELIWNKRDGSDSIVKYKHYNFIAQQFSQNFSKQIGDWCEKNGIAFTGHLLREPQLIQAIACGETMRNYGHFGIPGIDILCNVREFTTAKQTQSCVHQYGKEGMLSELYGVTNWDFDFRGHKLQGDWQAALGVTVRVPHLAWVSMKGEAKRDYPAAIGYQSPWYKEYSYIENHFARLNTALTRGKPIVNIGVIHPIESYWISTGPNSQSSTQVAALENNFANITDWLLESHLDFNYICESTIPELEDKNNPGTVGKMHYDAIIVPGCLSLRTTTVDYLTDFLNVGGKVIFMGDCPTYIDGIKSNGAASLFEKAECISFDKAAVNTALEPYRKLEILLDNGVQADEYIYNYREDSDRRFLFIARSKDPGIGIGKATYDRRPQKDVVEDGVRNTVITVKGEFIPTEYNTVTGEITDIEYEHKNGNTVIYKTLDGFDSLLLSLSDKTECVSAVKKEYETVSTIDIRKPVSYTLSEPNVLLLDRAEYAYDDGEWQAEEEVIRISEKFKKLVGFRSSQTQPYAIEPLPAKNTVHLRYTFESEIEYDGALLAIEDADIVTVKFNGKALEKKITGYFTDESISTIALPAVKKGENILEVDVPFSERSTLEWCYILGDFGVKLMGCCAVITDKYQKLGFSDVTAQGLPFYGANITYYIDVDMPCDGALEVNASYYRGSLIGVSLDGERAERIVLPPYNALIENVKKGKHTVSLTVFGNRHNCFGALHLVNEGETWFGPDAWHTKGTNWCYEYRLRPFGILKSPVIKILK